MYNKIFTKILDSSIWLETDQTRIVWLTMLASMNQDGFCQFASPANLAHRAIVPLAATEEAIRILESPDVNSSDPDNEGRRIERVNGGWMVLNASKYRDIVTAEVSRKMNRERVKRFRDKKQGNAAVMPCNDFVMQSEAETEAETEAKPPTPPAKQKSGVPSPSAKGKNQITDQMAARAFCEELGFSGALIHQTAYSAIQSYLRHNPEKSPEESFRDMVGLWREYEAAALRTKCGAQSWLSQGIYHHPEKWRKSQPAGTPPSKDSAKKNETPSALPIIEEMRRKRAHAQAQTEEPGK